VTATGVKILPRYNEKHSDNKSGQSSKLAKKSEIKKGEPPHSGTFWADLISEKYPAFSPVVTDSTALHVLTFLRESYGDIAEVDFDNLLIPLNLSESYLKSFENTFIPALTRYNQ
jgi:hypothetical protein